MRYQGLVPAAAYIEETGERFVVSRGLTVRSAAGFEGEAALLREQIPFAFCPEGTEGLPLDCLWADPDTGTELGRTVGKPAGQETAATGTASLGTADESYRLTIGSAGITCAASSAAGMYHGLQSLRQIILTGRAESGRVELPRLEIADAPRFRWRGFMLDCSRHFYSVAFIKKIIDAASLHHLNVFHWHLTDDQGWRLPVPEYPKLTDIGAWRKDSKTTWQDAAVGGFYSEADIAAVVAWAAARHVDVVPEVDLPGHSSPILAAYPELGCAGGPYAVEDRFGIFKDVLCAGNDGIFPLIGSVFDTLARLFPSKYVHIGGDEVKPDRWEECPKCQARRRALGLGETAQLQSWITVRLANMLAERGKTPIGWDEVLEGTERFGLPSNMVVMSWRGREGGLKASGAGHPVIMTALTDGCYLNFRHLDSPEEPGHLGVSTVEQSYSMEAAAPGMSEAQRRLVLGGQCNLWSEVIYASRIAEYMLFPRMGAIAEALWTAREKRDIESFERRLPTYRKLLDALDLAHYRGPVR